MSVEAEPTYEELFAECRDLREKISAMQKGLNDREKEDLEWLAERATLLRRHRIFVDLECDRQAVIVGVR